MQRVNFPFEDNFDIRKDDLYSMESYRVNEFKEQIKILITSKGVGSGFTNSLSTATGFTLLTGKAYDANGERIEKTDNEIIDMSTYSTSTTYYLILEYTSEQTDQVANPVTGITGYTKTLNTNASISNGGLVVSTTNTALTDDTLICLGTITYGGGIWTLNTDTDDRDYLSIYTQSIELPLYSQTHQDLGNATDYFGDLYIKNSIYFKGSSVSSINASIGNNLNISTDSGQSIGVNTDSIIPSLALLANYIDIGSSARPFKDSYFNTLYLRGSDDTLSSLSRDISLDGIAFDDNAILSDTKKLYLGSFSIAGDGVNGISSTGTISPSTDAGYNLGSGSNTWGSGFFNYLFLKNGAGFISTLAGSLTLSSQDSLVLAPTGGNTHLGSDGSSYYFTNSGYGYLYRLIASNRVESPTTYYGGDITMNPYNVAADSIFKLMNVDSGYIANLRLWYSSIKYGDIYTDSSGNINFEAVNRFVFKSGGREGYIYPDTAGLNNFGLVSGNYFNTFDESDSIFGKKIAIHGEFGTGDTLFEGIVIADLVAIKFNLSFSDTSSGVTYHIFGAIKGSKAAASEYIVSVSSDSSGVQSSNGGVTSSAPSVPSVTFSATSSPSNWKATLFYSGGAANCNITGNAEIYY